MNNLSQKFAHEFTTSIKEVSVLFLDVGGTILTDNGTSIQPLAGVNNVLEMLSMKFRLIAITNGSLKVYEHIKKHHLERYFEMIICSSEAGTFKPEKEIFNAALYKAAIPASEVLMIGDSLHADIFGAWNCGIRAFWIFPESKTPSLLSKWGGIGSSLKNVAHLLLSDEN
jgi:FMN phosphatase YigB (HAD superfamily)